MVIARVTPLAAARGFRSSHQKPPAGAGGMTRRDHQPRVRSNARMVMATVTPLAAARGFRSHHQKPPAEAGGMTRRDQRRRG